MLLMLETGHGAPQNGAPYGRRVLIVEDDRPSRVALGVLCCQLGLEAVAAASLAEAMALLPGMEAGDRIVLDLLLPDGEGLELLRRVGAERLPVRVAVVTGVAPGPLLRAAGRLRPDLLLIKPVNIDRLAEWLTT